MRGPGLIVDCRRLRPWNEAGLSGLPPLQPRTGRGVLDGALAVLDALGAADDGLGLSALVRATGLAKASAYRSPNSSRVFGAAQRLGRRYYVGERIGRIGRRWEPAPAGSSGPSPGARPGCAVGRDGVAADPARVTSG